MEASWDLSGSLLPAHVCIYSYIYPSKKHVYFEHNFGALIVMLTMSSKRLN